VTLVSESCTVYSFIHKYQSFNTVRRSVRRLRIQTTASVSRSPTTAKHTAAVASIVSLRCRPKFHRSTAAEFFGRRSAAGRDRAADPRSTPPSKSRQTGLSALSDPRILCPRKDRLRAEYLRKKSRRLTSGTTYSRSNDGGRDEVSGGDEDCCSSTKDGHDSVTSTFPAL